MTVKEIREIINKEKYVECEIYKYNGSRRSIHTDFIISTDAEIEDVEIQELEADYELLNEEEYNNTIYANCGEYADFAEWYGDKDAKVLVIVLR